MKDAMEKAINYIDKNELPPHWDKESLFTMSEAESTTESSEAESVDNEVDDDDDDLDDESVEEKDYLVAELYKHMEDRGTPINK